MPRIICDLIEVHVYRMGAVSPQFLLLRRSSGEWMGGTWHAIYGRIEAGETAAQAALRELGEETGLRPVELHQLDIVNTFFSAKEDAIYHCPVFAAKMDAEVAVTLDAEHDTYEWLAPQEAAQRYLWPGQRRMMHEIIAEIINANASTAYLQIPVE